MKIVFFHYDGFAVALADAAGLHKDKAESEGTLNWLRNIRD